jgi:hypothetical protein
MLLRYFFYFGLVSLVLGLPTPENVETNEPGVYVTDTYTDHNGIERRSTKAISKELHERLIYWSEYSAAAYCPPQQEKTGGKVACQPAKTCLRVEASNTKIYSTWIA